MCESVYVARVYRTFLISFCDESEKVYIREQKK